MQEAWVSSLGQEDPLEKGMATHSSILTRRSTWKEEPGGLEYMGSHRVFPRHRGDEGLRLLHGLEANLATSLQTPQEA